MENANKNDEVNTFDGCRGRDRSGDEKAFRSSLDRLLARSKDVSVPT